MTAWRALREVDPPLYYTVGLARFAGLRAGEIGQARRSWLCRQEGGGVEVELRDRPEDGYQTKTGVPYFSPVLDAAFATDLLARPEGLLTPRTENFKRWLIRKPQAWLRPFVGAAVKPLHRLRGLYAADLAERTRKAVLASLAGTEAASKALGHTTTRTTRRHYL